MKRKSLISLLAALAVSFSLCGLVACNNSNSDNSSDSDKPKPEPSVNSALVAEDIFDSVEIPWKTAMNETDADKSENPLSFSMTSGVTVRVESLYNENGLNFGATIAKADYEELTKNADYSDFSFGMVIAPASWVEINPFTYENLFGENAKYCFSDEEGKAKIINVSTTKLAADGDVYGLSAALVNLKTHNIGENFVGRAYIKYVANDVTQYVFADYFEGDVKNNTRSMAEVAVSAVADISANALSAEKKEILNTQFVAKSVTVNHYFQQDDGKFRLNVVSYISGEDGENITAKPVNVAGYEVNENYNETVKSGTINYNGTNPILKLYYQMAVYDVTFMSEDKQTVINSESITYGGESEYASYSLGEVRKKLDGRNVYSFLGWTFEDGTDATRALASVTSDLVVYESFSAEPVKQLDAETERYLYCDRPCINDVWAHRALRFDVPEDSEFTDTFTIKFKVKYDANYEATVILPSQAGGQEFGRNYFVDDAGSQWSSVEFNKVPILTTDDFLLGFRRNEWPDNWMGQLVYDVGAKDVGVFVWVHALKEGSLMQFKDIEIIKEEKEKPVECDYSFTHAVGDARNDVLTIPAADFNLQESDKVTVTLKLKSNISNVYAVPVYVTNLGDRTTGSEYKLSTYTDWTEVSFKMTVTTGATAKLKVMQSWDTFANSTVDENAVGLFFFILNSSSCYNQSLWAKDVTVKKIEDEKPTDYDYSYTHADGDTRNDVLMISAADFNLKEGDKVKVTLKLKSNISNEYAMPVYVTDLGDRTTGSEYKLSTYTDWTEVSFKMTVTTGATAKSKVTMSWADLANSTVDENAVGLFFFILNSSSCYNQSLWAKDVTIEKLP